MVPMIAAAAPAVLDLPIRIVLVGAIATVGLTHDGAGRVRLAALRTRAFPRAAALLLVAGGLAVPLALSTPYLDPLAIAIGWIGLTLGQNLAATTPQALRQRSPRSPVRPSQTRHPPSGQKYSHEALTNPLPEYRHPFPGGVSCGVAFGGALVDLCHRRRHPNLVLSTDTCVRRWMRSPSRDWRSASCTGPHRARAGFGQATGSGRT